MILYVCFFLMTAATAEDLKLVQTEIGFHFIQVEGCGENEEYRICGATCFPTCFVHYYPQQCTRICWKGCYCKDGFVQARNGTCIRPVDCPREIADTVLDRNCIDEPERGTCTNDIAMWYYDRETGDCRKFYYGGCGGNGNRYPSEQECLQHCSEKPLRKIQCGENSHYNACSTCPITCENYKGEIDCMYCNPGCYCDAGYVLTDDGSCVLPENCPKEGD